VESGDELIRYFEMDAFRLESIINAQADEGRQVDRDDIALLAMSGLRDEYLVMRMKDANGTPVDFATQGRSLRRYLYDKYVYRNGGHVPANGSAAAPESDVDQASYPPDDRVRAQIRQPVS
jgi:hypothetical protein